MTSLKLVVNNSSKRKQKFFVKQELKTIFNLYAQKVSSGDWKDYSLSVNKREISFDVYQRTSEKPLFRISKSLNPKSGNEKFSVLDKAGKIIVRSSDLESLITKVKWRKLKLVK
tara:strand:- start:1654 stop:1995 length:342 start_codon:yes stop_codon:yes gene_type:complete